MRRDARRVIEQQENDVVVSAASIWELAIKRSIGKLTIARDLLEEIDAADLTQLPITVEHAEAVAALPLHHRDPFDRLLIAQAQLEGLTIVTRDAEFAQYDVSLLAA